MQNIILLRGVAPKPPNAPLGGWGALPRRADRRRELRHLSGPAPGRLSVLSVSHRKSVLFGTFILASRALKNQKRRFAARAVAAEFKPARDKGAPASLWCAAAARASGSRPWMVYRPMTKWMMTNG